MNIRKLNSNIYKIILLILVTISLGYSITPDANILKKGNLCINYVLREDFKSAHYIATSIIKQFPESPAGYFFKSAVYMYQMNYLHDNKYEKQLYSYSNKGIALGEELKSQNSIWGSFFLAATLGVRGTYERDRNRLVTSLKLGWRAVEIFKDLEKKSPDMMDALYGVAIYDYWVGANKALLWWMPGVEDNRVPAIASLEDVKSRGLFTKKIVLYDLMSIYQNEKMNERALEIANMILKKYPQNSTALFTKFDILLANGKYIDSQKVLFSLSKEKNSESIGKEIIKREKALDRKVYSKK